METMCNRNREAIREEIYEGDKIDTKKRDPVTPYGPGVRSYFVVQRRLLKIMTIICAMIVPFFVIYLWYDGMNFHQKKSIV